MTLPNAVTPSAAASLRCSRGRVDVTAFVATQNEAANPMPPRDQAIERPAEPLGGDAIERRSQTVVRVDPGAAIGLNIDPAPVNDDQTPGELVRSLHTASRLNLRLWTDYRVQQLRTMLPLATADIVVGVVSMLGAWAVADAIVGMATPVSATKHVGLWLTFQIAAFSFYRLYPGAGLAPVDEIRGSFRGSMAAAILIAIVHALGGQLSSAEAIAFAMTALSTAAVIPCTRGLIRHRLASSQHWGVRVLVVGCRRRVRQVLPMLEQQRASGLQPIGYVCNQDDFLRHRENDTRLLGAGFDAAEIGRLHRAPVAVIASREAERLGERLAFQFPMLIDLAADVDEHPGADTAGDDPVGAYRGIRAMPFLSLAARTFKRTLDLCLVIPGMIVLAIPTLWIIWRIKRASPGPAFYASPRVGRYGRPIRMWKFRTMVTDADAVLKQTLATDPEARRQWERDEKLKDDPRIIAGIGHLLRRSSLDELPQLFNVLRGEMSLVGPRPLPPGEIVKYSDRFYQYSHMWPGLTGLWQVSGRNDTTFAQRISLVHQYAKHWSIWLDLWILCKTPWVVITRRGAY